MNYPIQGDQLTIEMLLEIQPVFELSIPFERYNRDFKEPISYEDLIILYRDFIAEYEEDHFDSQEDLLVSIEDYIDVVLEDDIEPVFGDDFIEPNYFYTNDEVVIDQYFNKKIIIDYKEEIKNKAIRFQHQRSMKGSIHNELITVAMHPNRIQKQLDQFDDIEDFFKAIGC